MKQFLRSYDQHHRQLGLRTVDALREIDEQWLHDRSSLVERLREQEDTAKRLTEELREARLRLEALEKALPASSARADPGLEALWPRD
jgi:chromosome segregation ATPase